MLHYKTEKKKKPKPVLKSKKSLGKTKLKKYKKLGLYTKDKKNVTLPLKSIHPNVKNPRKGQYDKQDLEELKENLDSMGQINTIKVDEFGTILAGHRRFQAAKELGWKTIRCDIIIGLDEFGKSALMISDNATQRQFNAWDSRKAIYDIYWNEFCEVYNFKNAKDKGYSEFARRLGVSMTQTRTILESMSKDNMEIIRKMEAAKVGTEVCDTILRSPKKYRQDMTDKALSMVKKGKSGLREHLRMYSKTLSVKEKSNGEITHPAFFKTVHYKLEALGIILTKEILNKASVNEKIKLKKLIEKEIMPGYKYLKSLRL